jgi:hypothetical protein
LKIEKLNPPSFSIFNFQFSISLKAAHLAFGHLLPQSSLGEKSSDRVARPPRPGIPTLGMTSTFALNSPNAISG